MDGAAFLRTPRRYITGQVTSLDDPDGSSRGDSGLGRRASQMVAVIVLAQLEHAFGVPA